VYTSLYFERKIFLRNLENTQLKPLWANGILLGLAVQKGGHFCSTKFWSKILSFVGDFFLSIRKLMKYSHDFRKFLEKVIFGQKERRKKNFPCLSFSIECFRATVK
jgi:hypothetical protein